MKYIEHLRRAEGEKTPKVELTISIDNVAIQEPKGKILHEFPIHHLSYCYKKPENKFFSFIAKHPTIANQHVCFVFVSDKLAEEITLTIGQAFGLAYRRFLETSDLEMRCQLMVLQKKVDELEKENSTLKSKLDVKYEKTSKEWIPDQATCPSGGTQKLPETRFCDFAGFFEIQSTLSIQNLITRTFVNSE